MKKHSGIECYENISEPGKSLFLLSSAIYHNKQIYQTDSIDFLFVQQLNENKHVKCHIVHEKNNYKMKIIKSLN